MDRFSEKSLLSLGDHYVYGLIDPCSKQIFYIGKGTKSRVFFVNERYEQGFPLDENEIFYIGKSIARLKLNQSAQNPITYLYPLEKDKIHI